MSVIHVNTDEEFQELVEKHETCLVDFSASWCGPCRMIAPFYEQQAAENPKIKFLKVDVDELEKVAQSANIRAMPTFIIYKNGAITNEIVRGANKDGILDLIQRNLPDPTPPPPAAAAASVAPESDPEPEPIPEPQPKPVPVERKISLSNNDDDKNNNDKQPPVVKSSKTDDNDDKSTSEGENKCTCSLL